MRVFTRAGLAFVIFFSTLITVAAAADWRVFKVSQPARYTTDNKNWTTHLVQQPGAMVPTLVPVKMLPGTTEAVEMGRAMVMGTGITVKAMTMIDR